MHICIYCKCIVLIAMLRLASPIAAELEWLVLHLVVFYSGLEANTQTPSAQASSLNISLTSRKNWE